MFAKGIVPAQEKRTRRITHSRHPPKPERRLWRALGDL